MNQQTLFLMNQALQCLRVGNVESAELFLKQVIRLDPRNSEALRFCGIASAKRGNFIEALKFFDNALKYNKNSEFIFSNKGNALHEMERHEEAIVQYDKAISLNPSYDEAYNNKGNALHEMERHEEAIVQYDKAISLNPSYAEAYNNKGNALQALKRVEEAMAQYDKAISLSPLYADAYNNRGKALEALGLFEESIFEYDQAISIEPNFVEAHFNRSHQNLKYFNFLQGWDDYEWRWQYKNFNSPKLSVKSYKPSWNGKNNVERLLVWSEQGIGDQILYSSVFHELGSSIKNIIVSVDKKMLAIYRRSFPNITFFDKKQPISEILYDEQIPIGSLAQYFRASLNDFRNCEHPYLVDDKWLTNKISSQLEFGKIKCGIAWRSINKDIGCDKSIPIIDLFPIIKLKKFQFINLQYGDITSDLEKIQAMKDLDILQIENIDLYDDVDSTLSLIQACDLIITSSNSTAHLAGALNKKTILILPYTVGKFWYWHDVDGVSLWYPSIRVFKQQKQGDWSQPIEAVAAYLENRFEI